MVRLPFFRAEVSSKMGCNAGMSELQSALVDVLPDEASVRIVSRELSPLFVQLVSHTIWRFAADILLVSCLAKFLQS